MAVEDDDWRLQGQERYLLGVALHWSRWTRPYERWDHDHCEFCWAKFMEEDYPEVLHYGYATEDKYRWICEQCFSDFKSKFDWRVEPGKRNS
jgi:hypothetical protein